MMSLPLFIEYKDDLTKQPPYSIAFSHYERDWNVLPWQGSLCITRCWLQNKDIMNLAEFGFSSCHPIILIFIGQ